MNFTTDLTNSCLDFAGSLQSVQVVANEAALTAVPVDVSDWSAEPAGDWAAATPVVGEWGGDAVNWG